MVEDKKLGGIKSPTTQKIRLIRSHNRQFLYMYTDIRVEVPLEQKVFFDFLGIDEY